MSGAKQEVFFALYPFLLLAQKPIPSVTIFSENFKIYEVGFGTNVSFPGNLHWIKCIRIRKNLSHEMSLRVTLGEASVSGHGYSSGSLRAGLVPVTFLPSGSHCNTLEQRPVSHTSRNAGDFNIHMFWPLQRRGPLVPNHCAPAWSSGLCLISSKLPGIYSSKLAQATCKMKTVQWQRSCGV